MSSLVILPHKYQTLLHKCKVVYLILKFYTGKIYTGKIPSKYQIKIPINNE